MKKLNCIICDECRIVIDKPFIIQGKKKELHYCEVCYRSKEDQKLIDTFIKRLKKIGIKIELSANYPWIYINKINGIKVTEIFEAKHGFTVAFFPVNLHNKAHFTDIAEIFKLIRKYV